jgi:cytosine/adenosine deaminase-related metal-dependent hydrolase
VRRYHARWVLPVGAPPVREGTVVVDGAHIAWVGPRHEAPPGHSDHDLGDAVLLPGLVNAHIHLDLAAFGGRIPTREFFAWIRALTALIGGAGADLRREAARWAVRDQLAHGVTTMADTAPERFGFDALREAGARGIAYREVFAPDPALTDRAMVGLREAVDAMRADADALVQVGLSPHAPYSVSDALYRAVAAYARETALPVAVHIAESPDESALVARGAGRFATWLHEARGIAVAPRAASPLALLEDTGLLALRPLCIHAVQADAADIARVARHAAPVAHCPCSNAWFGHGRAPLAGYRDAGVVVGLGTDSIASNEAVRLRREARAAADPALSAAQRLALATMGGAAALGLGHRIGRLVAGYEADLVAFALPDLTAADADPAAALLALPDDARALLVLVAGRDRTVTDPVLPPPPPLP